MTTALERSAKPKPRAGRRPFDPPKPPTLLDWINSISDVCGTCAGKRVIWCPECWGFAGCATCGHRFTVACPQCAGGKLEPLRW